MPGAFRLNEAFSRVLHTTGQYRYGRIYVLVVVTTRICQC
jgi:hypothetical protein